MAISSTALAQTMPPSREYVRFGGRVIAIENPASTESSGGSGGGSNNPVSTPTGPVGPASGLAGSSYAYSAGGATPSDGGPVQYLFTWGDGTDSGWLAAGTSTATHTWISTGSFTVAVQARSATNPSLVSAWSLSSYVFMADPIPFLVSFSPVGGNGSHSLFTSVVRDYGGASNIQVIQDWFWSANGSCHLVWYKSVNRIYLDSADVSYNWVGSGTPGQSGAISNGFCSVDFSASSITAASNGTDIALAASVTFLSPVSPISENLSATNSVGSNSWTAFGNWNSAYSNLTINQPIYHVGDSFTMQLNTNMPNTSFTLCNPGSCTQNFASTDANGNWSLSGSFDSSTVGNWQEWVVFPLVTSNSIFFTINP